MQNMSVRKTQLELVRHKRSFINSYIIIKCYPLLFYMKPITSG